MILAHDLAIGVYVYFENIEWSVESIGVHTVTLHSYEHGYRTVQKNSSFLSRANISH